MNKYLTFIIFLVIFALSPLFVQTIVAQPPPPPPQAIPLDGGLSFLLVAGVAYAAKRLYRNKEQDK